MTSRVATGLGGVVLLACALYYVLTRVAIDADYAAFLPAGASPTQQAFMSELRDGVVSRIILVELSGAAPEALAQTSDKLARALERDPLFGYVTNGSAAFGQRELAVLERHRYVLSDGLDHPERLTATGLRTAFEQRLEGLAGTAGMLEKRYLANDPTAEIRRILQRLTPPSAPARLHGVWFDATGTRALLLAQTRAPGSELGAQQQAVHALDQAFAAVRSSAATHLEYSSPGTMALESRTRIAHDARVLSLASMALVVLILVVTYRSLKVVVLCLLPAVIGLLAGVIAVNALFGTVHGITLAFGATLLGEAVDYPSYMLTQIRRDVTIGDVKARFGRTLRLAVLTTAFGALALLFSGFPGLQQLGLLTVVGVLVAGAVTLWALPHWIPSGWSPALAGGEPWALPVSRIPAGARWAGVFAAVAICGGLAVQQRWWNDDLAAMNPLPAEFRERDLRLRAAMAAPDVRYMLVLDASTAQDALRRSEAQRPLLEGMVADGAIKSFDLVSDYLPSAATQQRRRAALPSPGELRANIDIARAGLPFRDETFEPFLRDVEAARQAPALTAAAYAGSVLGLKIESLLRTQGGRWHVVIPLSGVHDPATLGMRVAGANAASEGEARLELIDMRGEATAMMAAYRAQAVRSSAVGAVLIYALLWIGLGSAWHAFRILLPVMLAVGLTAAVLVASGNALSLFHYVALLLTLGVGVNYALIIDRAATDRTHSTGVVRTLAVVSATALATFGVLALSTAPVLHAIGITVSLGVMLSLCCAALLVGTSDTSSPR